MMNKLPESCTAFAGTQRIASGGLPAVAREAKAVLDRDPWAQILIFDDATSEVVEVDLRGSPDEVLDRINNRADRSVQATEPHQSEEEPSRRPGRPKLGVISREVTLLPRHWEWLASQPGGASVALRKLVEQARRENEGKDRQRRAQESAYRFLSAMAGNRPGFEEATRALFAGKRAEFNDIIEPWPSDVRDHARQLAAVVFDRDNPATSDSQQQ